MNTGIKTLRFPTAAFGLLKLSQLATTANILNSIISDARIHILVSFIEKNTNKSKSNHQASKNAENKEISLDVLLYRRVTTIALLFINLLCIKKGACNLILGGLNCNTPSNAHNIKIL